VRIVRVPRECVATVHAHLRTVGRDGYEGLGLWVGRQNNGSFQVTTAVIPAQKHIRTRDGVCVIMEGDELHRLNVWLYKEKLTLLAQIHSHPREAYHSSTDDQYAVATAIGCLSLVVPNFAHEAFDLRRTASYRLSSAGIWTALSSAEAEKMFVIEG
jgi:hypothetical protein